jgi:nucleoredoxin
MSSRHGYRAFLITALLPLATHAAVEMWTGPDGAPIQAEFIRKSSDYITFQKATGGRYLLPYSKLSDADRARIDAITARLAAAPAVTDAPATTSTSSASSAKIGKVIAPLVGKLDFFKGSKLLPVPQAQLAGIRYVAVYYSAHWCPPCRAFTPKLVSAYNAIKFAHPEFEIIFVSSDRDEDSMKTYIRETGMAWPVLRFDQKANVRSLQRPGHERGIPNLVFMTAERKELSTSYTPGGDYSGPGKVLADIKRHFEM